MMRQERVENGDGAATLRLAFTEWGPPAAARTVVCVHGLTRNARDFDALAARLGRAARVLCLDVAGRGGSDWLADPRRYDVPVYAQQLRLALLRLGLERVDWIGTSMGGLIGISLAAAAGTPIRRLVLNDIGPLVASATLEPIRVYLGLDLKFRDLAEVEQHLRLIHAGFGALTDAQWRHLAAHSVRTTPDGLRLHYDPAIRVPFLEWSAADVDLWPLYERISCPTLVIRGADSPVLDAATARAMTERGPRAHLLTIPGCAHAPALMAADQTEAIAGWLGL
jgi:pimeloyl-ACP methyl ester carboxylesterase